MIRRRMTAAVVMMFWPGCLWLTGGTFGCRADDTTEERMRVFDHVTETMVRHGVAGQATVHFGGKPSVGMTQDFYFNTDGDLTLSVQFNSATGRGSDSADGGTP